MTGNWDLVIVGGGPAGLTAALTAASAGLRTVIVDESDELGGQYFKQRPLALRLSHDHRPQGRRLIDQVLSRGVAALTGHVVWGADESGALMAAPRWGGTTSRLDARFILIATGAHEFMLPFPGWTLPGVVTPGFALHTAVVHGAKLGERVAVAGTGPFLLLVAQELLHAGVNVVAVADEASVTMAPGNIRGAAMHPREVLQFAHMLSTLARHRVPWWRATRLVAANGGPSGIEGAVFERNGAEHSTRRVRADVLCVAYGFKPNSELARLLGCECRTDPVTDMPAPVVDSAGRTTVDHIYVAGDAASIGGAALASARGYLAVADMCRAQGHPLPTSEVRRRQRQARRLIRFAHLNAQIFPTPIGRLESLPDDVVVCRCEAVTAGQVRQAAATGWYDLSGTKGLSRAGMGPCQGRECAVAVSALTSGGERRAMAWSSREPVRPVRLGTAAGIIDNYPQLLRHVNPPEESDEV